MRSVGSCFFQEFGIVLGSTNMDTFGHSVSVGHGYIWTCSRHAKILSSFIYYFLKFLTCEDTPSDKHRQKNRKKKTKSFKTTGNIEEG